MSRLLDLATDSRQYDRQDIHWLSDGEVMGAGQKYATLPLLRKYLGNIEGQSWVDIGCGTGWTWQLLHSRGATDIWGVEPSDSNCVRARQHFPQLKLVQTDLENFNPGKVFDGVITVMTMEHIKDLNAGFTQLRELLRPTGRLLMVVADFDYHSGDRHGREIERELRSDGSVLVGVHRPWGVLYDIIRPIDQYIATAETVGFKVHAVEDVLVTKQLAEAAPRMAPYTGKPIFKLVALEK